MKMRHPLIAVSAGTEKKRATLTNTCLALLKVWRVYRSGASCFHDINSTECQSHEAWYSYN